MIASRMTRRSMLAGGAAAGGLLLAGVGTSGIAAPAKPTIVMHRSEGCGCCLKWADAVRAAGFKVEVVNVPDIMAFKARHGVPQELTSCHTSLAGPYVIEGHVPLDAIQRLLRARPKVKGIGVAGMPVGTPGMESPDGTRQKFEVMAFTSAGKLSRFAG